MPRLIPSVCLVLCTCLALAGCGADGAPEPPTKSGITISGEAGVGVVVK